MVVVGVVGFSLSVVLGGAEAVGMISPPIISIFKRQASPGMQDITDFTTLQCIVTVLHAR